MVIFAVLLITILKGLSVGLPRQATCTTTRLGTFSWLMTNDGKPLPLYQKAFFGLVAGAIEAKTNAI
ncbi:hypothetical protein L1987_20992 [Smallanthus sonchifolius]|uniref:Uncharacterized protein n=1 Tax=Smallanthus sonchifolius TaxID=185202 RepID=A0ACB9IW78_9ASTR|nr:hypothetical protein L1987_20992 [Smallanthus sonchifolius]